MSSKGQYVEERVVEMRIDHDKFEAGANKTISTLEKLEKALHLKSDTSAIDALEKTVNDFDASPMTNGLNKIKDGFSALEIVGMRVISNLTDSIYNFTAKTIKSFTIEPIAQGFQKFGEKTTSIATLTAQGYELEKVNALMEELNWFTDETSYNFTDMVGNIAKFTATGQDLDSSVTAMEGIALWAALSGQNAQKASMAMYQLSQAMGKGALKYDDYKSIQNASMDTQEFRRHAAEAAVELGVLRQVGEDTWEVLSEGKEFDLAGLFSSDALSRTLWFNSDVMMKVFNEYSKAAAEIHRYQLDNDFATTSEAMEDLQARAEELANIMGISLDEAFQQLGYDLDEFSLKAFKAGQQARTWGDVVDSVKDAVSTGWMNTFEKFFGDTEETIQFMTDLANEFYDIFAEGGNIRNSILGIAFGGSKSDQKEAIDGWSKFEAQLAATGHTAEDFEKAYHEVARTIPEANLEGAIAQYGSIQAAFENGAISAEVFQDVLYKLTGSVATSSEVIGDAAEMGIANLEELKEVAIGVIRGDYGNGEDRKKILEELGYDYETVQALAEIMYNGGKGWVGVTEEFLESNYPSLYEKLLQDSVTYLGDSNAELAEYNELLAKADSIYSSIVGKASDEKDIFAGRRRGSDLLKESILNLIYAVEGVQGAFRGAMTNVFGSDEERADRIWRVVNAVHSFTERIQLSEDALGGLQKIIGAILTVLKTAGSILATLMGIGQEVFFFFYDAVADILAVLGKGNTGIGAVISAITNQLSKIVPIISRILNAAKKVAKEVLKLLPFYDKISQSDFSFLGLDKLAKKIDGLSLEKIENAVPLVKTIHEWIEKILTTIESDDFSLFNQNLEDGTKKVGLLSKILSGLTSLFTAIYDGSKKTFANLKLDAGGISTVMQKVIDIVSFLFEGLFGDKEFVKTQVSTFITTIWTGFLDGVKKISFRDVVSAIRLGIIASIAGELIGVLRNLKKTTEEISSIPENFSRILKNVGDVFSNFSKSIKANIYIKIAVAIGILTASIMALQRVNPDKLTHVAVVLGLLMFVMSKMATSFAKAFSNNNVDIKSFQVFGKLGGILIGLGVLIGGIGSAIAKLAAIQDKTSIWNAAGVIAAFIGVLGIIMMFINRAIYDYEFDEIGTFGKALLKAAASFVLLGLAIKMITKPIISISEEIGKVGGATVWSAMGALAVLVMAMGVALAAVGSAKFGNAAESGSGMLKAAGAMIMIGIAVKMMVGPLATISLLASYDKAKLLIGFLTIVGILAGLSAVLIALNKWGNVGNNGSAFMKAAAAMIIVAFAVRLMVTPLITLGAMKGVILTGLGALAGILVLLGGTIALLSRIKDGDKLLKVGKAMGILAIGIGVLVGALSLFGAVVMVGIVLIPWELLAKRLAAFKESLGTLLGLGAAALLFGVAVLAMGAGIAVAGTGLLKAAIGFVIFSFGLGLFSDGIIKVSAAIPTFIDNLKKTGQAIMDAFSGASTGQLILGAIAIGLLVVAIVKITSAFSNFLKTDSNKITDKFKGLGKGILAAVGTISKGIGPAIMEHLPEILSTLVTLVSIVGLYVLGLIPDLVNWIGSAIITLFESIAMFVRKNKAALEHSVFSIVEVVLEVLFDAVGWVLKTLVGMVLDGIQSAIGSAIQGIANMLAQHTKLASFFGITEDTIKSMQDFANDTTSWSRGFANYIDEGNKQIADSLQRYIPEWSGEIQKVTKEEIEGAGVGYKEGMEANAELIKAGTPKLTEALSGATAAVKGVLKDVGQDAQAEGANLPIMYAGGMASKSGVIADSADSMFGWVTDTLGGVSDNAHVLGQNTSVEYANGMTYGFDTVVENLQAFGLTQDQIMSAFGDNAEIFGANTSINYANGLPDGFQAVVNNLQGMGLSIDKIMSAFGMNAKVDGKNTVTLYNNGMVEEANSGTVYKTANQIGSQVVKVLDSHKTDAEIGGKNLITGFNKGIVNAANHTSLFSNIQTIGNKSVKVLHLSLGEHSPSVYARQAGQYLIEGLNLGITDEADGAVSTVVSFGSELIAAIMKSMAQVNMIANDDLSISPHITPIVDMSNVTSAAGAISNALDNNYNVSASMGHAVSKRLRDAEDIAASMSGFGGDNIANNQFTINIYASEGMDENEIANAVMYKMRQQFAQRKVAFG